MSLLSLCGPPRPCVKAAGVYAGVSLSEKALGVVESCTCAWWHAGTQHAVQASASCASQSKRRNGCMQPSLHLQRLCTRQVLSARVHHQLLVLM